MLSLFLKDKEIYTEDHIIDEVARPIFAAGVGTTQYATQSVISYLTRSPETLNRIREEFS